MGRMVDTDDLCCVQDFAEALGLPFQTARHISRFATFPPSVFTANDHNKVWLLSEVREWCRANPDLLKEDSIRHGTRSGYSGAGCRCDSCTAAQATAARLRYRRTRAVA